jgi:hypothetical protein
LPAAAPTLISHPSLALQLTGLIHKIDGVLLPAEVRAAYAASLLP